MEEMSSITIGSFVLTEPTTVITNIFLAALCWLFSSRLGKVQDKSSSTRYWQLYFILMGTSAATGIFKHGLVHYQSEANNYITWSVMNVETGFAIYFAQLATVHSFISIKRSSTILQAIITLQLGVYLAWFFIVKDYSIVKWHIALGLVPIMLVNGFYFFKGATGRGWLAVGIVVGAFAAAVHGLKFSFGKWFNYNDIAHLFIMASLYMMFYGINTTDVEEKKTAVSELVSE